MDKIGIMLINTGTPASPDPEDIKMYLTEFLTDPNVVRNQGMKWKILLNTTILRKRPKTVSPQYEAIWTDEGSPLLVESFKQREALEQQLTEEGYNVSVVVAMRYGAPSIHAAFSALEEDGCTHTICLPLFPQTSFATTYTCAEKVREVLEAHPTMTVDIIEGYYNNEAWIDAIAASVRQHLCTVAPFCTLPLEGVEPTDEVTVVTSIPDEDIDEEESEEEAPCSSHNVDDIAIQHQLIKTIDDVEEIDNLTFDDTRVIFSFHSLPESNIEDGDTYIDEVEESVFRIVDKLGLPEGSWTIAYQSEMGNGKWLEPCIRDILIRYGIRGVKNLIVVSPGFATDNLETLHDCAEGFKETFERTYRRRKKELYKARKQMGDWKDDSEMIDMSTNFTYVPPLNSSPEHINALADVLKPYLDAAK